MRCCQVRSRKFLSNCFARKKQNQQFPMKLPKMHIDTFFPVCLKNHMLELDLLFIVPYSRSFMIFIPFWGALRYWFWIPSPVKSLFFPSMLLPSQLAGSEADFQRKLVFWDRFTDIVQEYSRSHQILNLGDCNTRLYSNHVSSMPGFVGPVILCPRPSWWWKLLCALTWSDVFICMISSRPQIHVFSPHFDLGITTNG